VSKTKVEEDTPHVLEEDRTLGGEIVLEQNTINKHYP